MARRRAARRPHPARGSPGSAPRTCSRAPTTIVSPEYGAGRPSTSRCVVVAGPPQRWQTAWSLSTNSARERSSGHRAERLAPEVLVEPCADHARAALGEGERRVDDPLFEELHLVDPDDLRRACARDELGASVDRDSRHPHARMTHDVGRVVAVVDAGLEEDHPLTGDLRAPEPTDHLLALAREHRAADDLEPSSSLGRHPDHRGDARRGGGRGEKPSEQRKHDG